MVANAFLLSAGSIDSTLSQVTFYRNGRQTLITGIDYAGFENLSNGVTMGAAPVVPICGWQGDIAEELVFDRQLTSLEMQQVWHGLSSKYGIFQDEAAQSSVRVATPFVSRGEN